MFKIVIALLVIASCTKTQNIATPIKNVNSVQANVSEIHYCDIKFEAGVSNVNPNKDGAFIDLENINKLKQCLPTEFINEFYLKKELLNK
jgi:hypothetical protein